jgi:predicted metalloprotease with PDZ domain
MRSNISSAKRTLPCNPFFPSIVLYSMRPQLLFIFILFCQPLLANNPHYTINAGNKDLVHVNARLTLINDTIFMYQRGTTAQLPEGEVGFVKNLLIKDQAGKSIIYKYVGEGNWILTNIKSGQSITIEYDLLTTHKQYNWDHTGGIDENAFSTDDGLFFTGYTLFILADLDMQNVEVNFELPAGWIASTPWQQKSSNRFIVENGRFLLNNCFMLGRHTEKIIHIGDMEMRLAISKKIAHALPLIEKLIRQTVSYYQQFFGGSPAPVYLVALNDERMTDGSAFRRSFSQIFYGAIDESGIPTWGYIMAHEILHLWNGHAIVPGTQEEWFKEGFTDYVTNLAMRRAGLIDDITMYRKIEHMNRRYWLDRMWQRDTLSIRETGTKKNEFRFGVYGGGAIVALALEVEMRKTTGNKKGIPDLMRRMYADFATTKKTYVLNDIIRIVNEETGTNLQSFFDKYVTGKEFLDLTPYLTDMGLILRSAIEEMYISVDKKATPAQQQLYKVIFAL